MCDYVMPGDELTYMYVTIDIYFIVLYLEYGYGICFGSVMGVGSAGMLDEMALPSSLGGLGAGWLGR